MNRKYIIDFLGLLLLILVYSQGETQTVKKFKITGKLSGNYNGLIFLKYHIVPDSPVIYSATVLKGDFHFNPAIIEPTAAVLSTPTTNSGEYLYLDTSSMHIDAKLDSFVDNDKTIKMIRVIDVKGSPSYIAYKALMKKWISITESQQDASVKADLLYATLDSLVKLYPDHNLVTQALLFSEILSYKQTMEIFSQLSVRQQSRSSVNGIAKLIERMKRTETGTRIELKDLKNENGGQVIFENEASQFVLLDFWASWCYPCRAVHPEFKKLFDKYHAKGFNIIGISLDTDKNKWLEAIRNDKINWTNASDLKGYSGYMASFYGLTYIPFNLLVDEQGKIIFKNISPGDIEALLEQKLKK